MKIKELIIELQKYDPEMLTDVERFKEQIVCTSKKILVGTGAVVSGNEFRFLTKFKDKKINEELNRIHARTERQIKEFVAGRIDKSKLDEAYRLEKEVNIYNVEQIKNAKPILTFIKKY